MKFVTFPRFSSLCIIRAELRRQGTSVNVGGKNFGILVLLRCYWYLMWKTLFSYLVFFFRRYHRPFSLALRLHLPICHHLISSSIQLETKEMVVGPEIGLDCLDFGVHELLDFRLLNIMKMNQFLGRRWHSYKGPTVLHSLNLLVSTSGTLGC